MLASGMDSTDDFNAIHSAKAKKMVEDYYIGDFDDSAPGGLRQPCSFERTLPSAYSELD